MTTVREITEEDLPGLSKMAEADGHGLWRPTHIVEIDGKMKGSLSLCGVPLVTAFIQKDVRSGTALREVIHQGQSILKGYGFQDAFVAVDEASPAYRFMPVMDFTPYNSTFWYKPL